jgi:hypothetical protein
MMPRACSGAKSIPRVTLDRWPDGMAQPRHASLWTPALEPWAAWMSAVQEEVCRHRVSNARREEALARACPECSTATRHHRRSPGVPSPLPTGRNTSRRTWMSSSIADGPWSESAHHVEPCSPPGYSGSVRGPGSGNRSCSCRADERRFTPAARFRQRLERASDRRASAMRPGTRA